MKEFIIVGAGPVGLWTAIQLRKHFPSANIKLFEKYKIYQRQHILKLQHSSLFFGAHKFSDEWDNRFFKAVFDKSRMGMRISPFKKSYVSTIVLEEELKRWALMMDCHIVNEKVDSLSSLMAHCRGDAIVIIANGAKSTLRDELLGTDATVRSDLQHIVELKTTVKKSERLLRQSKTHREMKKQMKFFGFEYIDKEESSTVINLRLSVDKLTYESLPAASFKSPIEKPDNLPVTIADDISAYGDLHGLSLSELFEEGKLSKLQLSLYHAKQFSGKYAGRKCFLVGDAAMGVPYFRALNSGLVMGSRLAHILKLGDKEGNEVGLYNVYSTVHRKAESVLAKGKNQALNNYDELRRLYQLF